MKNLYKLLGIIAIAAVIGFSFIACGDGDGDGGGDNPGGENPVGGTTPIGSSGTPENPVGTVYLGETLTLSGQVYTNEIGNTYKRYTYTRYTGSTTVEAVVYSDWPDSEIPIGGSGAITNGQLNFTIGKPDYIKNLGPEDLAGEFVSEILEYYTNIQASKPNVRGIELYLDASVDMGNYSVYGVGKRNTQHSETDNSYSEIDEWVTYIYVEEDVTVSGKGKTQIETYENDRITITTKDFTLALKKGWNAVYYLYEDKGTFSGKGEYGQETNVNATMTLTVFLSNPALRWTVGVGGGSGAGGDGQPSNNPEFSFQKRNGVKQQIFVNIKR
jgi:hypothetical protein